MIVEHQGKRPRIASSTYVAPTAVVAGDVEIDDDARVLFGTVVTADGGPVRIGVCNTVLPVDGLVPIGWVGVGDPAQVFPPSEHERIWAIQERLDFPRTVFGLPRAAAAELMPAATQRYAAGFGRHRDDRIL